MERSSAAATPRQRSGSDKPRKTGWQVRSSVADAVKRAVEAGAAASQNAFVERAVIRELRELRRRRVYEAYAAAAEDPVLQAEMDRVAEDFDSAAGDGMGDAE